MICRITWTETLEEGQQQHVVDFSFRDYRLNLVNEDYYLTCNLFYHFTHENEILLEKAILNHTCEVNNVELIINDGSSQTYNSFHIINDYSSYTTPDGIPLIMLQLR